MKLGVGLLLSALGVSFALGARADEAPRFSRVALLLPACEPPGLGASELRSALALDLRDEGLALAPIGELTPVSDVLVTLDAACAGSSELTLQADFEGERRSRRIELGEVPPPQRARALSLALVELLSLFTRAPEALEPPAPPPAPPASSPAPVVSVSPPPKPDPSPTARPSAPPSVVAEPDRAKSEPAAIARRFQVSLAPEVRVFEASTLWGGRAALRFGRWCAGVGALGASTSLPTGSVRTLTAHASLGYAFPLWGTPAASRLEAGPRLGAGRTFMTAAASPTGRAADAQDVYLDAAAAVRYSTRVSDRWRVGLGGELGYARGPIGYADDQKVASTAGVFASLFGEVAWEL